MPAVDHRQSGAKAMGRLLALTIITSLCGGAIPACVPNPASVRLGRGGNIMLIIADDLGCDKVGIYGEGDDKTRPQTPHLDRLAAQGVRFVNAYASPLCSPTRAALLTGRYGFRTGIGKVVSFARPAFGLPLDEISIPEMLDMGGSGYQHSHVGKWHLSTPTSGGAAGALAQGFNWSAGSQANVDACESCGYSRWEKQTNGVVAWTEKYATTDTTDDAIFRAQVMPQPWFMWVAYNAPHRPLHVPPDELHSRRGIEGSDVQMYAAMVEAMDAAIGRLLASMSPSVRADTTVIFMGDNGTPSAVAATPTRSNAAKGTLYEGGINVPFIVSGAAVPRASRGKTCAALIDAVDLFATVAELAGVDLTQTLASDRGIDSVSLLPCLADPRHATIRSHSYSETFRPNGQTRRRSHTGSIRDQRWKLIRDARRRGRGPVDQFFDLNAASAGSDGEDLCPCPTNLDADALAAYERLVKTLEALRSSGGGASND